MSEDLRPLTPENQQDAIDLLNRSSTGTSLSYDLDIFGFRWIARYWNISYELSFIYYVKNEPVAVMLNCVDPEAHDAYTFYWGVLPKLRNGAIALPLVETCCKMLRSKGYETHYAVALPDRPVRRYRFVGFTPEHELIDLETHSLRLPEADSRFQVREVAIDDLPQWTLPPAEYVYWCQRRSFLHHASSFVKFLACFADAEIKAFAVVLPQYPTATLTDLRSAENCMAAGHELLRWLTLQPYYGTPLTATYVSESSYAHQLLTSAGFVPKRRFFVIARDLRKIP